MINKALLENTTLTEIEVMRLSEESKASMADKIISKLYKKIQKKSKEIDAPDIDASAGDLDKLYAYADLKAALSFLEKVAKESSNKDLKELVEDLRYTEVFLQKHKKAFIAGYRRHNTILKSCYYSTVGSLIHLTAYAISTSLVFVNNGVMFETKASTSTPKLKRHSGYKCLKQILELDKQNKLDKVFKECLTLTEGISLAWIGIALLVLTSIRGILELSLASRVKTAEYLDTVKGYVELNQANVRDPQIKSKQQKWVARLEKMRDRLVIDQEVSSARAMEEISQEDAEDFNVNHSIEQDLGLL